MKIPLLILLLVTGTALGAAELVLEDYDGVVEVRSGAAWKALTIGSPASEAATVRVTGNGLAEFRFQNLRIHISKDGTYQLAALVEKARKAPALTLFEVVAEKTDKLLGKAGRQGQVNAGVRADQVGSTDLTWADEDEAAPAPDADEVQLGKARELSRQGRNASALREALKVAAGPSSRWYPAAALLVAQEALTVGDYDLVITRSAQARPSVDPETAQSLLYLEALARTGLGQNAEARTALQAVVAAGSDTPVGLKADSLLRR